MQLAVLARAPALGAARGSSAVQLAFPAFVAAGGTPTYLSVHNLLLLGPSSGGGGGGGGGSFSQGQPVFLARAPAAALQCCMYNSSS